MDYGKSVISSLIIQYVCLYFVLYFDSYMYNVYCIYVLYSELNYCLFTDISTKSIGFQEKGSSVNLFVPHSLSNTGVNEFFLKWSVTHLFSFAHRTENRQKYRIYAFILPHLYKQSFYSFKCRLLILKNCCFVFYIADFLSFTCLPFDLFV